MRAEPPARKYRGLRGSCTANEGPLDYPFDMECRTGPSVSEHDEVFAEIVSRYPLTVSDRIDERSERSVRLLL